MNLQDKPIDSSIIQALQESPNAVRALLGHIGRTSRESYEEESIRFLQSLIASEKRNQLDRIVMISMGKNDNPSPEFFSMLIKQIILII